MYENPGGASAPVPPAADAHGYEVTVIYSSKGKFAKMSDAARLRSMPSSP